MAVAWPTPESPAEGGANCGSNSQGSAPRKKKKTEKTSVDRFYDQQWLTV